LLFDSDGFTVIVGICLLLLPFSVGGSLGSSAEGLKVEIEINLWFFMLMKFIMRNEKKF
jgi:hypothetical protein